MNSLTIRNIPGPVEKSLRRIARESHKSINKTVIELLAKSSGVTQEDKQSKKKRDVRAVFTQWSNKEHKDLQNNLKAFNHIDDELWR